MRLRKLSALLVLLALGVACPARSDLATPEQTVRAFIDRMLRVHGDRDRARSAYELLASAARDNLIERARRASAATGAIVHPEEMLAPSRFLLDFPPASWATREAADWAIVTAVGKSPGDRREIRCVRENGQWRVVLDLPPLPPIERRRE